MSRPYRPPHEAWMVVPFAMILGLFIALIAGLIVAELAAVRWPHLVRITSSPEILHAVWLSIATATLSTLISLWIAIPSSYLLSRLQFRGKVIIELLLDAPLVLPPLVVGLGLLLLFQSSMGVWFQERVMAVSFQVPAIVIAQVTVSGSLAIRSLRATFDQIDRRPEEVALTLGCSRGQAMSLVALPQATRGIVAAGTLAWARAFGEFGPVLVFAGTTRMRTEVLPTSIYLELNSGNLPGAAAVSLVMLVIAAAVLLTARRWGVRP